MLFADEILEGHNLYEVPDNNSDSNHVNDINRSSGLINRDTISLRMYRNVTPVFVNNRIIFLGKDGVLRSVNSKDVKKCYWELQVTKHTNLYRASILYSENLIFYIVDDNVYGIDFETGEIKWQKELRSVIAGSPVVIDNHLMIVTIDNYLYFFNVSDGSLLSSNQESLPEVKSYSSLSSASYGDIIVFSFSNGKIAAFNSLNGLKIWESNISHANVAFNNGVSLQAANNTVIAVDKLHSISNIDIESGNTRWSKNLKIQGISQIEEGNIAAVIDNKLVLMSIDTGDFLWQYDLLQHGKSKNQWSSPVIMNDEILVIGNDGCVILIDCRSGALKLVNYVLPSAYYIPILGDSSIYVVTNKDKIIVFR
ncbi:PQQ-binding-like beta-propeller repeat protein [Ehrlichia japonica]|uniref:PQQ enzyme repeat family protein n=1 Tax=Ehrlichia japonica TaxID=391036 RepID=X5H075_9RICK|nr:PQQ-binding-like beta-propeller repeat protein [Ehrlichia japonica]AHX04229.1 PQQ enzyme repeat family protein [Ehrlichia japonica]